MYTPETILNSGAIDHWESASEEERSAIASNRPGVFDPMLAILASEAKIDGLPTLMPYGELRERFGSNVLVRGVDRKEYAYAFREGAYWAGRGTYGSGTYAVGAKKPSDAFNFAERYYCGENGVVLAMAMALGEGAVVKPYSEVATLRDEQQAAFGQYYEQLLAREEAEGTLESVERLKIRAEGADAIYANLGRFMAAHGIDALYRPYPNDKLRNGSYYLIVNRSKVIVATEG